MFSFSGNNREKVDVYHDNIRNDEVKLLKNKLFIMINNLYNNIATILSVFSDSVEELETLDEDLHMTLTLKANCNMILKKKIDKKDRDDILYFNQLISFLELIVSNLTNLKHASKENYDQVAELSLNNLTRAHKNLNKINTKKKR